MKYKVKLKDGSETEVEVNETDVITAVKDEYEKKLGGKDTEIKKIKEDFEKEKEAMRAEHVKQMRAILTGRKEEPEKTEFEEEEKNEEDEMVKTAKEYYKKLI